MTAALESLNWRAFLGRAPLPAASPHATCAVQGQSILITGAGGSIGAALALQLAVLSPSSPLILLEASESHLFALQQDFSEFGTSVPVTFLLGSVSDRALLGDLFAVHAPRIVFHAAAFKHVPLLEEQPLAAIENNIFGTKALASAASAHNARLILLSTDKAVEPASIMGATKRVAEQIALAAGGTALRLGNVLASRDSVAELFARQIAAGGPVTVTDPAARRYFLTLDEAVDLLLSAASETGSSVLLTPNLPAPRYIADLARFMAEELAPDKSIRIEFTQPRPGDKEVEKLWSNAESVYSATAGGLLTIQSPRIPLIELQASLDKLRAAVDARDLQAALVAISALVPDYTPSAALLATVSDSQRATP